MKTKTKALILSLCAILLVATSILGTMAYLTSQDKVTNTFTVGNVAITLDETNVGGDSSSSRVKENTYHLVPGSTYVKDPTVHIDSNSESCYVFVKVENGIADFEAANGDGYTNIAGQITNNGWTALSGAENVYYKTYIKGHDYQEMPVFSQLKIADTANTVSGWDQIGGTSTSDSSELTGGKTITVTAYAVQLENFNTAEAAWNATFGK